MLHGVSTLKRGRGQGAKGYGIARGGIGIGISHREQLSAGGSSRHLAVKAGGLRAPVDKYQFARCRIVADLEQV